MENEYSIKITSTAEEDLDSILNYIGRELSVPETAVSRLCVCCMVNLIILKLSKLEKCQANKKAALNRQL